MSPDIAATAKRQLEDLLSFYEINAPVELATTEDTISLSVNTEEGGRLIGHRGETLGALQHLLNMMVRNRTAERVYVHVDVGGYRQARLEKLEEQAREAATRVIEGGEEVELPMMNAAERRHIHSVMTDVAGVRTESRGEGSRRRLVVVPSE